MEISAYLYVHLDDLAVHLVKIPKYELGVLLSIFY